VLVNKQNVVLETGIEMRLESEVEDDRIMVAVDVRVYAVKAFEHLSHECWEGFGKWYT